MWTAGITQQWKRGFPPFVGCVAGWLVGPITHARTHAPPTRKMKPVCPSETLIRGTREAVRCHTIHEPPTSLTPKLTVYIKNKAGYNDANKRENDAWFLVRKYHKTSYTTTKGCHINKHRYSRLIQKLVCLHTHGSIIRKKKTNVKISEVQPY